MDCQSLVGPRPWSQPQLVAAAGVLGLLVCLSRPALAQSPPAPPTSASPGPDLSDLDEEAREAYRSATSLAKLGFYAEALVEYAKSDKLHPHAKTLYLMAVCERALGRDMRARKLLRRALEMTPALDAETVPDAKVVLEQLDKRAATLLVTVSPADVVVQADGRPLEEDATAKGASFASVWVAGTADSGPGSSVTTATFEVRLDAGHHRIVFSRVGYDDVTLDRDFDLAARVPVRVSLDRTIQRWGGYGGIALGGVGLVAASVTFAYAAVKLGESNQLCRDNLCTPEGLVAYSTARDAAKASTWLLPISAATMAAGIVLWATSGGSGGSKQASSGTGVGVSAGGGYGFVGLAISGSY